MKRYLIAAGVGSMVFAAALGSASALSVNPGVAQTGAADLRGDSNGVVVQSYGYEADDHKSYFVRVADVDPTLAGSTLWALVYDEDGDELTRGSASIAGSTVKINWDQPVLVEDIESVRLTIE